MSTTTVSATVSQDKRVLQAARDTFDHESKTNNKLKADQVIVLIEDVCIDTRCVRAALPQALRTAYEDAARRIRVGDKLEFITRNLTRDMERALAAM
jgi:pyrimidine operon attenuation protein/uracil phosphoribosyltransferase